jgi:hypothetical protein
MFRHQRERELCRWHGQVVTWYLVVVSFSSNDLYLVDSEAAFADWDFLPLTMSQVPAASAHVCPHNSYLMVGTVYVCCSRDWRAR